MTSPSVPGLVDGLFRRSAGHIVSTLARTLGPAHLDLAEEALQDALLRALEIWPHRGVPENPEGWLMRVARNRALDLLRRHTVHEQKSAAIAFEARTVPIFDESTAAADELRLLLLCLHPTLSPRARVALALKTVGGFGVGEIAQAFLARPEAVAQLLVRAKRTIRESGMSLDLPAGAALGERLESALDTIYLLFNEGYSPTEGDRAVRKDVCVAAIRFAELLIAEPETTRPEVHALLALMCFQASRLEARGAGDGDLLLLDAQDRTLWDQHLIRSGFSHLDRSATGERLTAWHVEAAIASCHAIAEASDTDWKRILSLYDQLLELKPSPVVRLNRAVALGKVAGAEAALRELDQVTRSPLMAAYPFLPAVRARFQEELGDRSGAAESLRLALRLARTTPERRLLESRLDEVCRSF